MSIYAPVSGLSKNSKMIWNLNEFLKLILKATQHTRLKACDHCILRSHIGQKVEIIQVHLTLEGECLRAQTIFIMHERSAWIPTWQTMDNVSWYICWNLIKPTSKRWPYTIFGMKGPHEFLHGKLWIMYHNIYVGIWLSPPPRGGPTQILANHVRVKGLKQLVWPSDESEEPSQPHGHGPWLMCEVALSSSHRLCIPLQLIFSICTRNQKKKKHIVCV